MRHRSTHLFGIWSAMSALLSPHDKPWPGQRPVDFVRVSAYLAFEDWRRNRWESE